VTCLVVDEAHRATGDYAYCGVVRFLMSRNQHFRVLALTATPGAKGEAVQQVIDNLHVSLYAPLRGSYADKRPQIGKIEVRTDESFDIVPYVHKKSFDLTVVPLGATLTKIRDAWGGLMQNYMGPLLRARLIFQGNPAMLAPYAVNMANAKIKDLEGGAKANGRYYPMIKTLGSMARAMEYLVIQSVSSFLNQVKDLESSGPKTLTGSPAFRDVLKECGNLQATPGYVGHPKMEKLRSMCIQHFMDAEEDLDEEGNKRETRVMVFCNYRAVVEEIVDCLNQQRPIIRATSFVGQGAAKGVKGINQKDQIEVSRRFCRPRE
jgi:ERCC4-related helicase